MAEVLELVVDTSKADGYLKGLLARLMSSSDKYADYLTRVAVEDYQASIDEAGLRTRTGTLKGALKIQKGKNSVTFTVDADYANILELGAKSSFGRYVPVIDKRLISHTYTRKGKTVTRDIGTHPGFRPYRFWSEGFVRKMDKRVNEYKETLAGWLLRD